MPGTNELYLVIHFNMNKGITGIKNHIKKEVFSSSMRFDSIIKRYEGEMINEESFMDPTRIA